MSHLQNLVFLDLFDNGIEVCVFWTPAQNLFVSLC